MMIINWTFVLNSFGSAQSHRLCELSGLALVITQASIDSTESSSSHETLYEE